MFGGWYTLFWLLRFKRVTFSLFGCIRPIEGNIHSFGEADPCRTLLLSHPGLFRMEALIIVTDSCQALIIINNFPNRLIALLPLHSVKCGRHLPNPSTYTHTQKRALTHIHTHTHTHTHTMYTRVYTHACTHMVTVGRVYSVMYGLMDQVVRDSFLWG